MKDIFANLPKVTAGQVMALNEDNELIIRDPTEEELLFEEKLRDAMRDQYEVLFGGSIPII